MNLLRWLLLFGGVVATVDATTLLPDYLLPPRFQIMALSEESYLVCSTSDGTCQLIKSPLDRTTVAKFQPRSHVVRAGRNLVSVGSNTVVRLSADTRTTNVIFSSTTRLRYIWNDDRHLLVVAHSETETRLVKLRLDSGAVVWSTISQLGYAVASPRYIIVQQVTDSFRAARKTYCYDAFDGKLLWNRTLSFLVASEGRIADGNGAIYASVANKILQLSGSTGREMKSWVLADAYVTDVSYCHGNLFAVVNTSTTRLDPLTKAKSSTSLHLLDGEKWRSVWDLSTNLPKTIERGESPWLILRGLRGTELWNTAASRLDVSIPGKLLDVRDKVAFSLVDAGAETTVWRTHIDSGVSEAILKFGPRGLEP